MTTAAVVGLGDISALHLAAIDRLAGIKLVGVCDVDEARAEAAAQRWGVPGFTDHRALLAAVRPDVVHVTTPHHQHVPVALDALGAGGHVLTEKPLAHTVASAEELVAAAEASESMVGVVWQNRYNPTSVAIRRALDEGLIGDVIGARAAVWWSRSAAYYEASPWRGRWDQAGGGVLINQAIHTLDLLLWFLGEPVGVGGSASTVSLREAIEVEDAATIVLTHTGGARSTLFATNCHHANDPVELEITGRLGALRLDQGRVLVTTASGVRELANDARADGVRSYWGLGHELLIADFHAHVASGKRFWLDAASGLPALRVLREVYRQSGLLDEPAGDPAALG